MLFSELLSSTCGLSAQLSATEKLSTVIVGMAAGLHPRLRMVLPLIAVMVGIVWSEPETLCVGAGETVLPQASETVNVRTSVQLQSLPVAAASSCVTVMVPQSE